MQIENFKIDWLKKSVFLWDGRLFSHILLAIAVSLLAKNVFDVGGLGVRFHLCGEFWALFTLFMIICKNLTTFVILH